MYRRELNKNEKTSYQNKYREYLAKSRGGFLTKNQKMRALELKHGDEGTIESDFWYRIKQSSRGSLVDLQMICDIANENQIKDIFGDFILIKKYKKNESIPKNERISLDSIIETILSRKSDKHDDLWKAIMTRDIMEKCLDYTKESGLLMTKSHLRLIDEIKDLMNAIVSVAVQVPVTNRKVVQF